MKIFQLKSYKRDSFGGKAAKLCRNESFIPCILYGGKEKIIHFNILKGDVRKLIRTSEVYIVELSIEGISHFSILKDKQFHPVSDEVLHIDFLRIYENKPFAIEIPVVLKGLAEGVKLGGKLSLEMRKLKVRGFYKDFPEKLLIDVKNLGLGKVLRVGDLVFDKLNLLNAKNNVVVAIRLTRMARTTGVTTNTIK